jgi:hypothetical protein
LGLTPVLEEDAGFKPGFPLAHSFWELIGGLTLSAGIESAFVLDACSLMAASLSSAQPVKPRKQKHSRATLNPQVNNLMMSLTLLKKRLDKDENRCDGVRERDPRSLRARFERSTGWKRQLADSRGRPAQIDDDQAELYPAGTRSAVSQM